MKIILNGHEKEVQATTLAQLIVELDLTGRPVAIERNRQVVSRRDYDDTPLAEGDTLELVTLVGGG